MSFITLTLLTGDPLYVNVHYIAAVYRDCTDSSRTKTIVDISGLSDEDKMSSFTVTEAPETVMRLIKP